MMNHKKSMNLLLICGIATNIVYFIFTLTTGPGIYFGIRFPFPFVFGTFLIGAGIIGYLRKRAATATRLKIVIKGLQIFIILITISFLIVEVFIIQSAVVSDSETVDYVLVLGAQVRGEEVSLELRERLDKSLEYIKDHPGMKIIVSGGQGSGEWITEAEAMKRYLVAHGVEEEQIIKEEKSTSTFENIKFTKEIVATISDKENIKLMIITSDFHLFRAKFLAQRLGFKAYGIPAPTPWFVVPHYYIREYFAVVKSFLFDRE